MSDTGVLRTAPALRASLLRSSVSYDRSSHPRDIFLESLPHLLPEPGAWVVVLYFPSTKLFSAPIETRQCDPMTLSRKFIRGVVTGRDVNTRFGKLLVQS